MSAREVSPRLAYMPALDGLRGVAVAAVLLFHADVTWMRGGHLGVTAFFTLSGFLITALLLVERQSSGTIALGAFWARRARRLVPAVLVSFGLIAVVVAVLEAPPGGLIGDAVAASTWVANWRFIFDEQSYADLFSSPSPFQHFWSLAVEEQFYVAFPLLAVVLLGRQGARSRRGPFALVLGVIVIASTVRAALLHDPSDGLGRAYYGTDARVAEILVGALLALVLVGPSGVKDLSTRARWVTGTLGIVGAAGLGAAFVRLGDRDPHLYDGGFLVVACFTAAVIAVSTQPGAILGRVLANRPAVALGKVSYGVYLFHWPIFILLTERSTGLGPAPLLAARCGVTVALAVLSYVLVETPIRSGRLPAPVGLVGWANGAVAGIALVAVASGQIVPIQPADGTGVGEEVAAVAAPATRSTADPPGAGREESGGGRVSALAVQSSAPVPSPDASVESPGSETGPAVPVGFADDPAKARVPPMPDAPPGALRVAMVGDSIGLNLGRGLEVWADERGDVALYNLAFPACPVSRGGERRFGDGDPFPVLGVCGWWDDPASDRYRALQEFGPDVVVVQDGVNEMLDRRLPEWGEFRRPGEPRFDQWLRDEYRTAFTRWTQLSGARIVVTNAPCADWDRYERFRTIEDAGLRVQQLNVNVYRSLWDVTVADLFERICPGGRYRDEVEGVQSGRPDGFHLSDEAAAALARNWLGPIVLDAADSAGPGLLPGG